MTHLTEQDISRIIEMAWEDRTPFEAISHNFDLTHHQLVILMRQQLSARSFKRWRQRHSGRKTKHLALRSKGQWRSHCPSQYKHK